MQFQGKLNEAEVKEAARFIRPKGYGARMAFSNVRVIIYAIIAIYIVVSSVHQHHRVPVQQVAIRLAILAAIIGLALYRYRRGSRTAVAQLDASLPDLLTLTSDGVRLEGPGGAQGFQPWANYRGFREGTHTAVLFRQEQGMYNVVPISALSAPEKEQLRGLLASYLPAVQN